MIYIIGHIKPDLDSAVSAVSLKYLFDKAACFERPNAQAVLASKANFETQTIFAKFDVQLPKVLTKNKITTKDTFILVDHNETTQRLGGIVNEQITDIFDHHKLALSFSTPIYITTKPWGSTNTIIWWLMEITKVKPAKNMASLMMTAIISDTIGFKATTTTAKDKQVFEQLNQIAQIKDIDSLVLEVLKAKSYLGGLNHKQLLTKDYKLYEFAKQKVLISQVETADQNSLLNQSAELIKEIANLKQEMKLHKLIYVITDIFKINSKVLVSSEDENLLRQAFPKAQQIKAGVYDIGPIMSRKKEIVPPIEKAMNSIN